MIEDVKNIVTFFQSNDILQSIEILEKSYSLLSEESQQKLEMLCVITPEREFKFEQYHDIRDLIHNKSALQIAIDSKDDLGQNFFYKNIGSIYRKLNLIEESISSTLKLLELNQKNNNPFQEADTLSILGGTYWALGNLIKAEFYLNQAYNLSQKFGNELLEINILSNLANIYMAEGKHWATLSVYEKIQSFNKKNDYTGIYEAHPFEGKGLVYKEMGKFDLSLENFLEGLRILEQSNNEDWNTTVSKAGFFGNIAVVYTYLGLFEKAESYAQNNLILSTALNDNWNVALAYGQLGNIEIKRKNFLKALDYKKQMLKLANNLQNPAAIIVANQNLAFAYSNLGEPEKALSYLKIAVKLAIENGRFGIEEYWLIYFILESIGSTKLSFLFAFHFACEIKDLMKLTLTQAVVQRWISSIEYIIERTLLLETNGNNSFENEEKIVNPEFKKIIDDLLFDLNPLLLKRSNSFETITLTEIALYLFEAMKAQNFLEKVRLSGIDLDKLSGSSDLATRKEQLLNEIISTQFEIHKNSESNNKERVKQLSAELNDKIEKRNFIDKEIMKNNPTIGILKNDEPPSLKEIQNVLEGNEIFIEFLLTNQKGSAFIIENGYCFKPNEFSSGNAYVFCITKNEFKVFNIGTTEQIENFTNILLSNIKDQAYITDQDLIISYCDASYNLFKLLLNDVILSSKFNCSKLIISPDGILNFLPFEILVLNKSPKAKFNELPYIVNSFDIQYIQSAQLLVDFRKGKFASNHYDKILTLIENAEFNVVNKIPHTKTELKTIYDLANNNLELKINHLKFSGESEGIDKYKIISEGILSDSMILHFSCHGLTDEVAFRAGALILDDNDDFAKGVLTSSEIMQLHINARLIVMSACQTAVGNYDRGEGLDSLLRAWNCSGAESILGSLWRISDLATAEYMNSFYKSIFLGSQITFANATAKRELIQNEKFSAPYYWGAFILYGLGKSLF